MPTLRLVLGDQLNYNHSWFASVNDEISYCLFEMRQETDHVWHHIQKVTAFFAAMRSFAQWLESEGHNVIYYKLDDKQNQQNLDANLTHLIEELKISHFEYQLPDAFRLDQQLKEFCKDLNISSKVYDSEHFHTEREEVKAFFKGKKQYLMESFYRYMRKKHGVLMDGSEPVTGRWNYDSENRKKLPHDVDIPEPLLKYADVREIVDMIHSEGVETIGNIDPRKFIWPENREDSLALLDDFIKNRLPNFGAYQDAMTDAHWLLFHSRLSFSLNAKMISPREVIDAAIKAWMDGRRNIDLAQVEGFVRQILGWREYMRGMYWALMPEYADKNYFGNDSALPDWYWTGETKMACLSHSIKQSLDYAYAHHIQRLMITGNMASLLGVNPDEVDRWYLGIYIDAIEWVEITNTRGMSQFADGGMIATKPYVSSANYVDKMSHYCGDCHYNKRKKTGEGACPFNSLYWHFMDRNRDKLENNPRIGMAYRTWDKMDESKKQALIKQADAYIEHVNEL